MQEENNRVQQLSQMIDQMVAKTVVDTCKEKVYDAVIPMVKDHILKTYGPLPEIVEVHAGRKVRRVTGIFHEKFETVLKFVSRDIPIYLNGPAGTGKNVICKQVAESLGLPFYFTNAVTQEYKLTGFIDGNGVYHDTEFHKAFTTGGVFFLDELDASIPEVLVILNAAIANRYFDFPTGKVTAHKDFRLIAAGNTTGTGSDSVYSGRYCLDGASLDRFAQIQIPYSEKIEKAVTMDDEKLIQFCHAYRKAVKDSGVNSIFSYRGLSNITSMKEDLPLEDLMRSCLTKGMTKDDLIVIKKSISVDDPENPYLKAFTNL